MNDYRKIQYKSDLNTVNEKPGCTLIPSTPIKLQHNKDNTYIPLPIRQESATVPDSCCSEWCWCGLLPDK